MPDEAYRGRYSKPSEKLDAGEDEGDDEIKARSGDWDENKHPRAKDGRFGHSAGAPRAMPVQPVSGAGGGKPLESKPSEGGSSSSVSDAVGKLHLEHGAGRGEGVVSGEDRKLSAGRKEPAVVGMRRNDVTKLADSALPSIKSKGLSALSARTQLIEMHDEPEYQQQVQKVKQLDREVKEAKAKLKAQDLSPQGRERLDIEAALKQFEHDEEEETLQGIHQKRYPKMWEILCANDSPVFDKTDFSIHTADFRRDENQDIERGIAFLARMLNRTDVPSTNDLNFMKSGNERSGYLADGDDDLPPNTVAVGTHSSSARPDVVVHEMAHWLIERNPEIQKQLKWHFDRRTAGETELHLKDVDSKFDADELYKKDKFIEPYMGKFYDDGQNEILTFGLQYFVLAPDVLAKKDPETFDFIYKLMRGHTPEVDPSTQRKK